MSNCIYQIKNHITDQCYIGKTEQSVQKRFKRHLSNAARGDETYLYRSIRKYGKENFSVEILEETTKELLDSKEIHYIHLLKPEFNMTKGGGGGSTTHLRMWVTDGTNNMYILKDDKIPDGFVKGRNHLFNDKDFQVKQRKKRIDTGVYEKCRQTMLNNNRNCKPITINGITYTSRKDAREKLNLNKSNFYKFVESCQ